MPFTSQQQEKTGFSKNSFLVCYTTRPQWSPLNAKLTTDAHLMTTQIGTKPSNTHAD